MRNEKKKVLGTIAASILISASALVAAPASGTKPGPTTDEMDPYAYCATQPGIFYGDFCCDWPGLEVPCEEPGPLDPAILYQEGQSGSPGL